LLISGLGTRVAAIAAAGMLLSFYLAYPPWPGVRHAVPNVEHSLFVDKNLIEVIALLAIAAMPTGTWFGVDGLIWRLIGGRRTIDNGGIRKSTVTGAPIVPGDGARLETQRVNTTIKV
jgi:hypothetical protein